MSEEINRLPLSNFDICTNLVFNIDGLNIKNSNELIERLTPFFYYLISTYLRETGFVIYSLLWMFFFHDMPTCWYNHSHLRLMHFWVGAVREQFTSYINQNILEALENSINKYCKVTFTKPITLIIWLKRSGVLGREYLSRDIIPRNLQYTSDSEEEESEEESEDPVISTFQSFKSDECVICLTNPPNVLFCNCGHIAICVECDKTKSLNICPICKTKTRLNE